MLSQGIYEGRMALLIETISDLCYHNLLSSLPSFDPLELGSMLLSYSRQVAVGIVHLKCKSYIHRDLAARNILVSGDGMVCKVSGAIASNFMYT